MANIMINEVCNLRCGYCFANDFVDPKKTSDIGKGKSMNIDDFKRTVDFIARDRSSIGLLGGEPTLHPKIGEMIEYLIQDDRIKVAGIFTNGIHLERVMENISHPKVRFLLNLNSPSDIGDEKYRMIIKNLDEVARIGQMEKFLLGINMYKPGFDHDYFLEALSRYGMKKARVAIVGPNSEEARRVNYLEYCREIKPSVMRFFEKLYRANVVPRFDCSGNVFPPCVLTNDEKSLMRKLTDLANDKTRSYMDRVDSMNLTTFPICEPIIDFTADGKAMRCFPMYPEKVDVIRFRNLKEISGYFKNRYDSFKYMIPIDESCRDCRHMKTMTCQGGCIAYRINKINEARAKVEEVG